MSVGRRLTIGRPRRRLSIRLAVWIGWLLLRIRIRLCLRNHKCIGIRRRLLLLLLLGITKGRSTVRLRGVLLRRRPWFG